MAHNGVIFIGSNPSAASIGLGAFDKSTKSGRTLYEWIDKAGITACLVLNLHNKPTPNNRPLKKSEIRAALINLEAVLSMYTGTPIVAVGKAAAEALTLLRRSFYEMPHPSGMNRLLNDPKYIEEKIKGLVLWTNPSKIESEI